MKIQLLSMGRSGSSYLSQIIFNNFDKRFSIYLDEPFGLHNLSSYDSLYIDKIIRITLLNRNIVIKNHIHQVDRLNNNQKDYFLNNKNWYNIILLRKNLFQTVLSYAVALEIDNFNDKQYKASEITIDKDFFYKTLLDYLHEWELISDFEKTKRYKQIVYYEDLTFKNLIDIKLFNFKKTKNVFYETIKTPYNLINITNKNELNSFFLDYIEKYSYPGINNNSGFFELVV